ncbi:hypothetical protein E2C01_008525 [Portunus trituberculatus]|uniref:Uncharacterized protein n=1 Tax=Portunus trituberculatus TaxID=210409 RepID=A0A5B7D4Q4_PORTR|nr:hypothetical protein [Portunus trituberculatus]
MLFVAITRKIRTATSMASRRNTTRRADLSWSSTALCLCSNWSSCEGTSSGGSETEGVVGEAREEVLVSSAATPTLSRASNRSSLLTLCREKARRLNTSWELKSSEGAGAAITRNLSLTSAEGANCSPTVTPTSSWPSPSSTPTDGFTRVGQTRYNTHTIIHTKPPQPMVEQDSLEIRTIYNDEQKGFLNHMTSRHSSLPPCLSLHTHPFLPSCLSLYPPPVEGVVRRDAVFPRSGDDGALPSAKWTCKGRWSFKNVAIGQGAAGGGGGHLRLKVVLVGVSATPASQALVWCHVFTHRLFVHKLDLLDGLGRQPGLDDLPHCCKGCGARLSLNTLIMCLTFKMPQKILQNLI